MKKTLAMLLALVLILAPVIQVGAAAPAGQTDVLAGGVPDAALATSAVMEAMAQESEYPDVLIYPSHEMYGKTTVRGGQMPLNCYIFNERGSKLQVVMLVYKGTIDEIGENDEPVESIVCQIEGYTNSTTLGQTWHTDKNQAVGDYTVLYALADMDGNILAANYCDVYISDKEIPLEALTIFVHELDKESDTVYTDPGEKTITLDVIRYPYHTTNRRTVQFETGGLESAADLNFAHGKALTLPGESGTYTVSAYVNEGGQKIEASLDIHVSEDAADLVRFEMDELNRLCYDHERPVGVITPSGVGVQDCLFMTRNPLCVAGYLGDSGIYLSAISKSYDKQSLVVSCGNSYDSFIFGLGYHNYETKVEKQPSCSEEGLEVGECVYCGNREETVLPKSQHDLGEAGMVVIQAPTATKPGLERGCCTGCEQTFEESIPAIFVDTKPDHYYSDAVDYCYENGLMNGVTLNTFAPDDALTRGQLVTVLYRYAGSPETTVVHPFEDVDEGLFYSKAVTWAYENGVVNGVTATTFAPNELCTREQFVTILHRYVMANGLDNAERADLSGYTDAGRVGEFAREAFSWAVANGIVNGMTHVTLAPGEGATRAQAATILYRYIQHIELPENQEPGVPGEG